ncbi:biotin--[acetyl-CoA-carboxylase] ligase [Paracoccus chinensis]|uniref:biotin--[biotin carboxyl-carrier protein] ligase n=1 Tax=Paracoccus chinensis TaxID=525640 RepID=A0A1G9IW46_9RHOB|nr:biotin--[acetyl-CoA-carboxylase] ligase [Paracoccus chinensis]SDL29400.1 BirA family transcriptional regulator, biotin operon repressor / biotin-[acetyl-CoA-carboxylase] ligase [Paracoccus chinensis]
MTDASLPLSASWPQGVGRLILEQTDSTNAEAARLGTSLAGPIWIMTRRQDAGRGRRGRTWSMPAGNFAATLALRPQGSPADVSLYSFVAALALHEALSAVCGPAARLAIKWPNDVLLNGGKVAGILLESAGQGRDVSLLAVGIGVNLAAAPDPGALEPGAVPPVSVLGETGHAVAPEEFLDLLAPAFARWQQQLAAYGFGPIRTAWTARAARLGQTITARTGATSRTGRFEGIDDSGALVLTTAAGREVIPAAEVFFDEVA